MPPRQREATELSNALVGQPIAGVTSLLINTLRRTATERGYGIGKNCMSVAITRGSAQVRVKYHPFTPQTVAVTIGPVGVIRSGGRVDYAA